MTYPVGIKIALAVACSLTLISAASVVWGQSISARTARERVAAARESSDAIHQSFPRLLEIDAVIRRDCAEKNQGKAADSDFCTCASALTMSLWRSGMDPQMVPRLQTFLNTPGSSAEQFLAYQGPELYAPLCRLATGR